VDNQETGGEVMSRESSELHRMEAHIKELQAELVEKENAIYQYNVWTSADTVKIAKLQAERDVLHGALMKAGGLADIDRWPERYPLVYGCMTDAIKENDYP
jgi:hypothetical protein